MILDDTVSVGYDPSMAKKTSDDKLTDQLRRAIEDCGMSRYQISRQTDPPIAEAVLSRFMNGKGGFSLDTLDVLAKALNLRIVKHGNAKAVARRKKP